MKLKNIVTVLFCGVFVLVFSCLCLFLPQSGYSDSERRLLKAFPEVSLDSVTSGEFAKDFEEYSTDNFPFRDGFRSIKAYTELRVFLKADNNGIYEKEGHISKLEYPMNTYMIDYATDLFGKVKEDYITDGNIYVSVIPDKNKALAGLSFDYDEFEEYVYSRMEYATPIEISDLLEAGDYYSTDTHWRQERIVDVAQRLSLAMDTRIPGEYRENVLSLPFYGVYAGQSALRCEPDTITYLTNDVIDKLEVEGAQAIYDMSKAKSRDPYEFFLSGNQPVVRITNPENPQGKRLVVLRDSFGSAVAPLLAQGYSEVVLVDLRYINSSLLSDFVDFSDADVLFLYSTIMLNSSLAMK